uniref:Uncharacterized protein n=1 Tax=Anopheles maculatus TaxID=74869 RepID=A0A182S641_9DIPT
DENTAVNHSGGHVLPASVADPDGWRRPRSESSADAESVYMTNAVLPDGAYGHGMLSRRSSITMNGVPKKPTTFFGGIKEWCIAWWHSGREDSDDYGYDVEEPSDLGFPPFSNFLQSVAFTSFLKHFRKTASSYMDHGKLQPIARPGARFRMATLWLLRFDVSWQTMCREENDFRPQAPGKNGSVSVH